MSRHVEFSRRGPIGLIELARPGKFNAISRLAMADIREAMDAFEADDSGVRVVLLHAQGRNFCTGADLDESRSLCVDAPALHAFLIFVHETLRRLEDSPIPVVGACQGFALAGGLELLLACDVVIAARDARLGDQHVEYGLVPAWGGSQRLPRQVGLHRSLDLMYSGRRLDAETAMQWGLVSHVVETGQLLDFALDYCAKLAQRSRPGTSAMKVLARRGLESGLQDGLQMEIERVVEVMAGPDVAEGLAAFDQRRAPAFRG